MRTAAVILAGLTLAACGEPTRLPVGIAADRFCATLVETICDRELACGRTSDRAQCRADAAAALDGCPLDVEAVALQEAGYDAGAAARYMDALRATECGAGIPDPIVDIPVFTPQLGAGAVCHSDVSCTAGLSCADVTVTAPQGVCTSDTGV